ncbi:MAG: G-D-S-L family lipolytic protein [Chitinophagaceae bacterium]|nr:G-D-S-L family lipolytic protein [Chitinophagaceae bacterium]
MRRFFFLIVTVFSAQLVFAQPFANEIAAFRKQDSLAMPPKKAILLVGSSSFRLWDNWQDYFPGRKMINRGFGGSSLPDVIRYADDVIFKYRPKQIIIYCGENDFAASDTVSVPTVVERFKTLFGMIRAKYKRVPVAFVSMKPSPSRQKFLTKYLAANAAIKDFLAAQKRTAYIDVYTPMLQPDGNVMTDIFKADNLHMNAKGYAIWKQVMEPYLLQ